VEPAATGGALEELVREHAALRRVATLVAREPALGVDGRGIVGTLLRAQLPTNLLGSRN
jgi:hypothetical protein